LFDLSDDSSTILLCIEKRSQDAFDAFVVRSSDRFSVKQLPFECDSAALDYQTPDFHIFRMKRKMMVVMED